MKKYLILIGIVFFITLITSFCNGDKRKCTLDNNSKFYELDRLPVDTIYHYFKNGKIYSMEIRDSLGRLNGINKIYYNNGQLDQLSYYVNDLRQGFVYSFNRNGKIAFKVFTYNNKVIGDNYWYNKDGAISKYNFLDFQGHNRNLIKWDSLGVIIKDLRPLIFVDSVRSYNEDVNKDNEYSYNVIVIISNPLKCRSTININYISRNGNIMKRDSVTGVPYYFSKDRFMDSLGVIKIRGSEYDSLTGKTTYQESDSQLYDEK